MGSVQSGQSAIYEEIDREGLPADLGSRVEALIESACNFHALDNPGEDIRIEVHIGPAAALPILTDVRTITGEQINDYPQLGDVRIRSLATGRSRRRFDPRDPQVDLTLGDTRRILVTTEETGKPAAPRPSARALYWEMRRRAEERFPVAFDTLRQKVLDKREKGLTVRASRARPAIARPQLEGEQSAAPAAVLIGVHWFELGGAERWAFETVRLAREAGLLPIVVSDKAAPQEYIDAPELEGAVKLVLSHPMDQEDRDQPLLHTLLETFDIRGVFVHHCQWLYDRTSWLKSIRPDLPIVDSTHILEYSGGGYAGIAAHVTDFIDVHHVISPQLQAWFRDVQGIREGRVVLAPLIGLSAAERQASSFRRREPGADFRLGFVGRFARQKRPYLFLTLLRDLLRIDKLRVRAVIQGDGELSGLVTRLIDKYRLGPVIEMHPSRRPVERTLAEIDCLVVTSQNEGITLTTLEAIAAGIPVVSADVGSQATLIPAEMLAPRGVDPFRRRARAIVRRLAADEDFRERVWRHQAQRVEEFSRHRSASEWARQLFAGWREDEVPQTMSSRLGAEESEATMPRVAAVVVAYNRVEKLKTVIASIEAQTTRPDWLVVVDNASTDGTADYLRTLTTDLELVVRSNPTNEGGAGGFADGMEVGYSLGADFVWIMDDDCYPEPDALAELVGGFGRAVDKLGGDVPFACSLVRYVDGEICEMNNAEPTWDWPRLLSVGDESIMVTTCSFVSVLFPRWVLERHGLPYREYFIWFDDAEYTKRLSRLCPGVQVLSSGVVHDMGENRGVNFSLIDSANAWKFSYGVRNQASYRLHHESVFAFLLFAARVVVGMRRGRVGRRLQLAIIRKLLSGISFNPEVRYPSRTAAERVSGTAG